MSRLLFSAIVPAALAAFLAFAPAPATADDEHGSPAAMTSDAAHAEAEGAHGGGEPNILEVQPNLAIFTVLVFLGLMFVLGRFAWKPLMAALHQREEHLEHVLHETERARNESEALLAEHRRQLAAAEDQIKALIAGANKTAAASAEGIVQKAREEAEASKHRAERDIATARDQALSEIWTKTADLAVSVAGKVLDKSLSDDDHRRLIDSAMGELSASSNGHGGARS